MLQEAEPSRQSSAWGGRLLRRGFLTRRVQWSPRAMGRIGLEGFYFLAQAARKAEFMGLASLATIPTGITQEKAIR